MVPAIPVSAARPLAWLLVAIATAAGTAWAGSDATGEEHGPDEGPAYYGFVKDASGVPVRDAKVSASYKNSLTLVTRSTATGSYKLRGFKKDIHPRDVMISCSKDGYKQIRVYRYPLPKAKEIKSVETECRLQRQ